MRKIGYQALREAVEQAMHDDWGFDADLFHELATPSMVLALLDERERNQQYVKRRDQENEEIALTVGKLRVELEAVKSKLNEQREYYEGVIAYGGKRIAELVAELVSQTYKLNELSGNSPVIPDGWISCSERMPDTKTAVLVAVEFDRKGDWRMKWATYIPGHPDANDGWIIPGASWKPSHWMPLPEPPQEAK